MDGPAGWGCESRPSNSMLQTPTTRPNYGQYTNRWSVDEWGVVKKFLSFFVLG